jgi:uncharacterized protein DUF4325
MKTIKIGSVSNGFAEDKDEAKKIRSEEILPALQRGENVALDFQDVREATQSFVHALVGQALQQYGESALELIEFKNCSSQLKSVIELVVDYSLGGFAPREKE